MPFPLCSLWWEAARSVAKQDCGWDMSLCATCEKGQVPKPRRGMCLALHCCQGRDWPLLQPLALPQGLFESHLLSVCEAQAEGVAHSDLLPSTSAPQDHEKQYVGFATLPNQVHRKSVKKGFDFTLMVAGETARGWRWLGHMVGMWREPALLTSLRCSQRTWILPSLCSGPCLRPCFPPQPVAVPPGGAEPS